MNKQEQSLLGFVVMVASIWVACWTGWHLGEAWYWAAAFGTSILMLILGLMEMAKPEI